MRLYELADEIALIVDAIEDGDCPDELFDLLTKTEQEFDLKVESCAKAIRTLDAAATAMKAERDRLDAAIKARNNGVARLKRYVIEQMDRAERTSVETGVGKVSVQDSAKKVTVYDQAVVPPKYVVSSVTSRVDKRAVKEAFDNGEDIPGCMIEPGERQLRVR